MGRLSYREMKLMGMTQEDFDLALETQKAQRRNGSPVQSIAVICGVQEQRRSGSGFQNNFKRNAPTDINTKALRKGSKYDQAALLLDQQALSERDPERAMLAREASKNAKNLSLSHQLEFDFFGGNMSVAFAYQDAVTERLFTAAKTPAQAYHAQAVLWQICRNLGWQNYACTKTAAELCSIMHTDKSRMARALDLLEQVGAIHRVKRGRTKVIAVTPEGAFRGNINNHAEAVEKFKLDVIEGGKADE